MLPQITLSDCEEHKTFDEAFRSKGCQGYFQNLPDPVRYYVYRADQKQDAEAAYLGSSQKTENKAR